MSSKKEKYGILIIILALILSILLSCFLSNAITGLRLSAPFLKDAGTSLISTSECGGRASILCEIIGKNGVYSDLSNVIEGDTFFCKFDYFGEQNKNCEIDLISPNFFEFNLELNSTSNLITKKIQFNKTGRIDMYVKTKEEGVKGPLTYVVYAREKTDKLQTWWALFFGFLIGLLAFFLTIFWFAWEFLIKNERA